MRSSSLSTFLSITQWEEGSKNKQTNPKQTKNPLQKQGGERGRGGSKQGGIKGLSKQGYISTGEILHFNYHAVLS